jgi:hypothetical protein
MRSEERIRQYTQEYYQRPEVQLREQERNRQRAEGRAAATAARWAALERVCPSCGWTFSGRHPNTQWCSAKCWKSALKERARIATKNRRAAAPHATCAWCRTAYEPKSKPSKYCSPRCREAARAERLRSDPEALARKRQRNKEWTQRPEVKARRNERSQELRQRPEAKARLKAYQQRPEVQARARAYARERAQRPDIKAAQQKLRRERALAAMSLDAGALIKAREEGVLDALPGHREYSSRGTPVHRQPNTVCSWCGAPLYRCLAVLEARRFVACSVACRTAMRRTLEPSERALEARRNRPKTAYDEALVDEICRRLAAGEPLRWICRSSGMPSEATVINWARADYRQIGARVRAARALARAPRACDHCGQMHARLDKTKAATARYCSESCRQKSYREQNNAYNREYYWRPEVVAKRQAQKAEQAAYDAAKAARRRESLQAIWAGAYDELAVTLLGRLAGGERARQVLATPLPGGKTARAWLLGDFRGFRARWRAAAPQRRGRVRRPSIAIQCPGCGLMVERPRRGQKWCSRACHAGNRPTLQLAGECQRCGRSVAVTRKYCSHACYRAGQLTKRKCARCGIEFTARCAVQRYCTELCRMTVWKGSTLERRRAQGQTLERKAAAQAWRQSAAGRAWKRADQERNREKYNQQKRDRYRADPVFREKCIAASRQQRRMALQENTDGARDQPGPTD